MEVESRKKKQEIFIVNPCDKCLNFNTKNKKKLLMMFNIAFSLIP